MVFLFSLLTHCKRPNSYVRRCFWSANEMQVSRSLDADCLFPWQQCRMDTSTIKQFHKFSALVRALGALCHRDTSKARSCDLCRLRCCCSAVRFAVVWRVIYSVISHHEAASRINHFSYFSHRPSCSLTGSSQSRLAVSRSVHPLSRSWHHLLMLLYWCIWRAETLGKIPSFG